jgi:hypothetical protein
MTDWRDVETAVTGVRDWARRLAAELAALPDTLERLRLGAASFQRVGIRLEESSAALDDLVRFYDTSMGETVRRSTSTVEELQRTLDHLPGMGMGAEQVAAATRDVQRTVEVLAALNPLWPRPPRPDRPTT